MREKLKILSEILKQNTVIKERLEKFYYVTSNWFNYVGELPEPAHHDILEYLGEDYALTYDSIITNCSWDIKWIISLSPWPLSDQTDETLTQIISLCKNVWKK